MEVIDMGKRQTLSTSDPPRKLRFGIKPLENDVLAPHAAASGPPSSLAASVKRMLQNGVNSAGDRRSMAGVEERGKAEELAPQQVSEEILSDGPEEDFRFATPLGPRLQAAASFVEQAGDAGIASASIAPGPQGLSAQQQFIANLLAPGETPLTTPMTKGGGPISRHALGPQLQRLLQEDRACYSKAGRRMKHGSPLELKCISMKVTTMHSPCKKQPT